MRVILFAAALLAFAGGPAFAQTEAEMSRAESDLRERLAPAGVAVDRTSPGEIRLSMPSDITFDFNRANLRPEFMPRVVDLARTLSAYPGMDIAIVGHADAIGSDGYNQTLSERRANSVGMALVDRGIAFQRINTSGMGELSPIASNADEWGRARNRRVEVRLTSSNLYGPPKY